MVPFFVGLVAGRMDHSHSHSHFQARTHARLARVRPTPSTKVLPGPPFVPGGCRSEMPLRAVTRLHVSAWFRGDCIETAATTLRRGNGARDRGGAMFLLRQLRDWPINAALCRPATTRPWSWVLRLATEKAATWSTAGATRISMYMATERRHRSMAWMARCRPIGRIRLTGAAPSPANPRVGVMVMLLARAKSEALWRPKQWRLALVARRPIDQTRGHSRALHLNRTGVATMERLAPPSKRSSHPS